MLDHQEAMVKSLVAVAWADGRMDGKESDVIEALVAAFGLGDSDARSIRAYAKAPRTLDEIPLGELSASDRRLLLQHAVVLTFVDGAQTEREHGVLAALVKKLHIPDDEAKDLLRAAEARAKRHLNLL